MTRTDQVLQGLLAVLGGVGAGWLLAVLYGDGWPATLAIVLWAVATTGVVAARLARRSR